MQPDYIAQTAQDAKNAVRILAKPPAISASTASEYMEACARSNSKASLTEPLTRQFEAEKLQPLDGEEHFTDSLGNQQVTSDSLLKRIANISNAEMQQAIYKASINRLRIRTPGAFVAEAGNFAAVTCWEPKYAPAKDRMELDEALAPDPSRTFSDRPLYTLFNARIEAAKRKHLYPVLWKHASAASSDYLNQPSCSYTQAALARLEGQSKHDVRRMYWKLCMTSRDPTVQPPVPGAVRAVIEPYVERWVHEDGMPVVWLEAGGPRARDVYGWLGFRTVDEILLGQDEKGQPITTWCMMYTKD